LSDLANIRKIALVILFLKEALRDKRKASDARIAGMLKEAQLAEPDPIRLDDDDINDIRNGRKLDISPGDQHRILRALGLLIQSRGLDISLREIPKEIEEQYAPDLPRALRQPISPAPLQGEILGGVAEVLSGVWRFFYVSPINRKGQFKPELRGTAAFFQAADSSSDSINMVLISGHSQWKGQAFVNDSHLYMRCSDVGRTETAFFVTNKPTRVRQIFVGVGTALERVKREPIPSVAGFICFGEKITDQHMKAEGQTLIEDSLINLQTILQRVLRGEEVHGSDADKIRKVFGVTYKNVSELRDKHRALFDYLSSVKINNKRGFPLEWLYLSWR
jgi:hypothetical protein